jgi:hypothetical protein
MGKPVSRSQRSFVAEAIDGAVDLSDLSEETRTAMKQGGMPKAKLAAVAGPDGRIDTLQEVRALYNTLEKYPVSKRAPLADALLSEFRRHAVRPLRAEDALTLNAPQAARFGETHLDVPGIAQMSLHPDRAVAGKMCFAAAVAQLEHFFAERGEKTPRLNGSDKRIQVATSEVASGRVEVDEDAALRARAYIDDCLDAGRPVLVGVSAHSLGTKQPNEGITEHFVTVCGRGVDEEGRAYYEFKDPGDAGDSGRFFVDPDTGKLYKPGKTTAEGARFVRDLQYEVSQVRTYRDMQP